MVTVWPVSVYGEFYPKIKPRGKAFVDVRKKKLVKGGII